MKKICECGSEHYAKGLCYKCFFKIPENRKRKAEYAKTKEAKKYFSDHYRDNRDRILTATKAYAKTLKGKECRAKYRKTLRGKMACSASFHKRRLCMEITDITTKYLLDLRLKTAECDICRKPLTFEEKAHLDHIIPLMLHGTHTKKNVRYVHCHCNVRRPRDGSDL